MHNSDNTILPKNVTDSMIGAFKEESSNKICLLPKVVLEMIITLKHARTFIASKQKMHMTGIELYDELIVFLEGECKQEI